MSSTVGISPTPPADSAAVHTGGTRRASMLIGAGILASRIVGLVRQRVIAHFFSTSLAADALSAAFRIPNFLQNLFGEGVLSASFIPVYSGLLARGEEEDAGKLAGAIGVLLALTVAVLVLLGVLFTPALITVLAPGFKPETRALTIQLVRIIFPGIGLLVMSAWCLGILNSHRRFLLSYMAPVFWNAVMIAALLWFGPRSGQERLAVMVAWASVAGSALQLLVQLPTVFRLVRRLRIALDVQTGCVRTVIGNFVPVVIARGVVQISGYIDSMLASLVSDGAVAILNYAQVIYLLPVSLFGMSISAASLPAMSSVVGDDEAVNAYLRRTLDQGLRRIAFFVVPSAAAFLAFGDIIAGALYQSGKFGPAEARWVWAVLAGSAVGLVASTLGRLYASTFYALKDTRTPLRFAILRVVLTLALGYLASKPLVRMLGIEARWGVAGLTASAGVAGWLEFALLRSRLAGRIGRTGVPTRALQWLWASALGGVAVGWWLRLAVENTHPIVRAVLVLGVFGVVYLAISAAAGIPEARALAGRMQRPFSRFSDDD